MKHLIVMALLVGPAAGARAAESVLPLVPNLSGRTVECSAFRHDADGSWVTLTDVPVQRQNEFTTVAAGTTFRPGGQPLVGLDVAAMLDGACPH